MTPAFTLEQLTDLEHIRQLKARYFRLMDTKQWAAMRDVFTEDAVVSGRPRDTFLADTSRHLEGAVTVHHGHMPELVLTGPDTARGVWAMFDRLEWPDGRRLVGYGHYEEEYRRDDGVWRISYLRLARLYVDSDRPRPDVPRATPGWLEDGVRP